MTINKFIFSVVFLLIFFSGSIYSQNSFFQKSPYRFNYGDSLEWKEPSYNDSSWQILFDDYIENENDFCWIRTNIYLLKKDIDFKNLVILIDLSADYEIYWNGNKLGQNFVGNFEKITKRGIYSESYSFNDSLVFLEKNTLAIRAKMDDKNPLEFAFFNISDRVDIKISEYKVFAHLFFLILVYFVLLVLLIKYFSKNSSLFLSTYLVITTFLMFISLFIEYLFFAGLVGFEFTYFGEHLIKILVYLALFSISLFFIEDNKVRYGTIYLVLIGAILLTSFFLEFEENYYLTFGLIPPFLIVYFYHEKKSFLKLYCYSFFAIIIFFNIAFNLSIINLYFLIILFYFSVIYFRKEDLKKDELAFAKLRTSRLETEMLKKIIQPHYIMNSLNAVIEWLEESPKEGLRFIKEISDEFRSFLSFSDQKLITLKDELQLCQNHLHIMEFRQHKKYILVNKLENLNRKIPPAIIHTLIENGITHHQSNSNTICFIIEEHNDKNLFELKVIVEYNGDCSSLSTEEEIVMKDNFVNFKKIKEGNGFKYIRSRLTESYGNNWELQYFGNESIWITTIKIIDETDT